MEDWLEVLGEAVHNIKTQRTSLVSMMPTPTLEGSFVQGVSWVCCLSVVVDLMGCIPFRMPSVISKVI